MGSPHGYMGTHAAWVQKLILWDKGQICTTAIHSHHSQTNPCLCHNSPHTSVRPSPHHRQTNPRVCHTSSPPQPHPSLPPSHQSPSHSHQSQSHPDILPASTSPRRVTSTFSARFQALGWLSAPHHLGLAVSTTPFRVGCQHHTIQPELSILPRKHVLPVSCFCAAKEYTVLFYPKTTKTMG